MRKRSLPLQNLFSLYLTCLLNIRVNEVKNLNIFSGFSKFEYRDSFYSKDSLFYFKDLLETLIEKGINFGAHFYNLGPSINRCKSAVY